jgi:prepilin-type processing-associated H-X9-DG protein
MIVAAGASGATGWSSDGRTFQLEVQTQPDGSDAPTPRVLKFDPATGSFQDVLGPVPSYDNKKPERDVKVTYDMTPLENFPEKRMVATWWLTSTTETEHSKAVIAEHAMGAFLAQGDKFVAYIVNGTVFTRQIIELTIAQYEQMRDGAARAEILSKAKQVALGLIIFAADHDNTISSDFKLSDLGPYLKNNSVLDGFVMVFTGGSLRDVAGPANTVLGYTEGPGGRAVAYVDGHVVWEKTGG